MIDKKEVLGRSYALRGSGVAGSFPVTTTDDSIDGLGGDFSVDRAEGHGGEAEAGAGCWLVGKLMSNKNFKLAELMQPAPTHQPSRCVII